MPSPALRLGVGVAYVLLVAVTVPGYQALLPTLHRVGAFNERCDGASAPPATCTAQDLALNLMFDLGVGAINCAALPWGFLVQRIGPRPCVVIASVLFALGAVCLALSRPGLELWTPGFVLLGAPAAGVIFPVFGLLGHFPASRHGLVQSIIAGAIDGSAAVFLIFDLLARIAPLWAVFWVYAGLPLVLGGACCVVSFAPEASPAATPGAAPLLSDGAAPVQEAEGTCADAAAVQVEEEEEEAEEGVWHPAATTARALCSWPFALVVLWMALYMTTKYFLMSNLDALLREASRGASWSVPTALLVFNVLLPCAFVLAPLTGALYDRGGPATAVLALSAGTLGCGACAACPAAAAQYAAIVLLVATRYYFFALAPLLLRRLFGEREQTAVYGTALFIGSAATLVNYPLTDATIHRLDKRYGLVALGLCVATSVVGALLAVVIQCHWRRRARRRLVSRYASLN